MTAFGGITSNFSQIRNNNSQTQFNRGLRSFNTLGKVDNNNNTENAADANNQQNDLPSRLFNRNMVSRQQASNDFWGQNNNQNNGTNNINGTNNVNAANKNGSGKKANGSVQDRFRGSMYHNAMGRVKSGLSHLKQMIAKKHIQEQIQMQQLQQQQLSQNQAANGDTSAPS